MTWNQEMSSSILEFLLLQAIPNSVLNTIFISLPISPPFSYRLLKSLLLRPLLIQSPFSSQTLTSLELIEQLDRDQFSRPPSEALHLAYSAVAVDLTVRFLRRDGGGERDLGDFFEAVNRIWGVRIGDLEEGEGKGLVSERLRKERRLMERAVGDGEARGVLRRRDTWREAMEVMGVYAREAAMEMKPTVLDMEVVETVRQWRYGDELRGSHKVRIPVERNESSNQGECWANKFSNLSVEKIIQEKNQLKPGDPKDHDMAERPLPMAAGASTFAGRNEMRMLAGQNEATTGGDCLTSVCSHLPLPNIIQEKNQLKPGDEEDHTMVEEPLPDIVQAAAGIITVGTGYISNHGRMEENQSLMDCNQAPSVDKGAEVSPAKDISSGLHTRVHDTFVQPSNVNQNPSELDNGEENQNAVSGNAMAYSIDKGTVTLSRVGKSTLIGKKRERFDDIGLQPGIVNQYPTERENVEDNQNAISGNATTSSLDKGMVAPSADGKSTLIGKKVDVVHDTGLQPSLMVQSPTERENEEENHNEVRADATSHDKGKVAIPTDGTSTLTGKKKDVHVLRKSSIMDPNPTARTHKWHDDSVSLHGTSPNPSEKRRILRPKRTRVSDTKIPWNREFAGRRNKKWWSTDEEDTLRKAVEMFGVGNWTLIKNSYPAIFEERTSGDLKDKWRNMIK